MAEGRWRGQQPSRDLARAHGSPSRWRSQGEKPSRLQHASPYQCARGEAIAPRTQSSRAQAEKADIVLGRAVALHLTGTGRAEEALPTRSRTAHSVAPLAHAGAKEPLGGEHALAIIRAVAPHRARSGLTRSAETLVTGWARRVARTRGRRLPDVKTARGSRRHARRALARVAAARSLAEARRASGRRAAARRLGPDRTPARRPASLAAGDGTGTAAGGATRTAFDDRTARWWQRAVEHPRAGDRRRTTHEGPMRRRPCTIAGHDNGAARRRHRRRILGVVAADGRSGPQGEDQRQRHNEDASQRHDRPHLAACGCRARWAISRR